MLVLQDIHVVVGREEVSFEAAYREYAAALTAAEGARLALFAWAPHGGGEGYEAVALVLVEDVHRLAELQARRANGDLADRWLSLESMSYEITSSVGVLDDAARIETLVASGGADHAPTLLRLDSFTGGTEPLELAPGSLLERQGTWSSLFGELDGGTVTVLSSFSDNERLAEVLAPEWTGPWPGQPLQQGAVATARLVRSVGWSAVH